jgi:ubiquinol-cytochrome c reductase cytochrome c subunit
LDVSNRRALGGLLALGALAAVGWVVGLGPLAQTPVPARSDQVAMVTGQVTQAPGQALYDSSCAACHGARGEGTADGPDITDAGAASIDFMLRTGRMPLSAPGAPVQRGKPAFDDAEIQALVAYASSFGEGPAIPKVQVTSASDLAAGRAAYTATCAACHGAGASGDAVGGGAVAPPLLGTAPTQIGEAIRTGPGAMPAFDENQISDAELENIAAYLAFLRDRASPGGQPVGGTGPVAEGYVAWIAYGVGLLVIARWVGRRGRR